MRDTPYSQYIYILYIYDVISMHAKCSGKLGGKVCKMFWADTFSDNLCNSQFVLAGDFGTWQQSWLPAWLSKQLRLKCGNTFYTPACFMGLALVSAFRMRKHHKDDLLLSHWLGTFGVLSKWKLIKDNAKERIRKRGREVRRKIWRQADRETIRPSWSSSLKPKMMANLKWRLAMLD